MDMNRDSSGLWASSSGSTGTVYALALWDADGPGPLAARLVAGGSFGTSTWEDGSAQVNNIAWWDEAATPPRWRGLGTGVNARVVAIAAMPDGTLVVGGEFNQAGGIAVGGVARWTGGVGGLNGAWSAMGAGPQGGVKALVVTPGGELLSAGGGAYGVGDPSDWVSWVSSWNGTAWTRADGWPGPHINGWASCLAVIGGSVYAGGTFDDNDAQPVTQTRRAKVVQGGSGAWSLVVPFPPASSLPGDVASLCQVPGLGIVAAAGASGPVRFTGSSWTRVGTEPGVGRRVLAYSPIAGLIADAGGQTAGHPANAIARWTGTAWVPIAPDFPGAGLGNYLGQVYALLALPDGDVAVGGAIAGGVRRIRVAGTPPVILAQPTPIVVCREAETATIVVDVAFAPGEPTTTVWHWKRPDQTVWQEVVPWSNGSIADLTLEELAELDLNGPAPEIFRTYGQTGAVQLALYPFYSNVQFRATISNVCGSVTSDVLTLRFAGPCNPADIAYDNGAPLPPRGACDPNLVNNGVSEADYNLFFATFFDAGYACDIANDNGSPLPPFGTLTTNNGVTEGDYNLFFAIFFDGCAF